jgi:hypothetical protein
VDWSQLKCLATSLVAIPLLSIPTACHRSCDDSRGMTKTLTDFLSMKTDNGFLLAET